MKIITLLWTLMLLGVAHAAGSAVSEGGLILLESVASMIKLDGQFKMVPGRLRDAVAFGYFDEAINKTGGTRRSPLSPRLELPLHPFER